MKNENIWEKFKKSSKNLGKILKQLKNNYLLKEKKLHWFLDEISIIN